MARIAPVRVRIVADDHVHDVPSPPHDALTPSERRAHIAEHPLSYLAVTRGPEDVAPDQPMTRDELLEAGKEALQHLLDNGAFGPLRDAGMYAYRLSNGSHVQTGVLCGVWSRSRFDGQLRAHEEVHGERRDHLARHLDVVRHQSSPIVAAHRYLDVVERQLSRATAGDPLLQVTSADGLEQTLWPIDHEGMTVIVEAIDPEPLYIIDGHHRTGAAETNADLGGEDAQWVLSALFPDEQMRNHAHHRLLETDGAAHAMEEIERRFHSHRCSILEVETREPGQVGVYGDHRWLLIDLPGEHVDSTLDTLEPVRLKETLSELAGLFGGTVSYRPGNRSLAALAGDVDDRGGVLFVLNPITMDQLFAVADEGLIMPPKSTYFSPKARSGLVVRPVDIS